MPESIALGCTGWCCDSEATHLWRRPGKPALPYCAGCVDGHAHAEQMPTTFLVRRGRASHVHAHKVDGLNEPGTQVRLLCKCGDTVWVPNELPVEAP